MPFRAWLMAAVLMPGIADAQSVREAADLQRVRDLVRAGVLPRRALVEAETEYLERGYRETLRRTLLSETLEPSEVQTMLEAARGLQKIMQERFDLTMVQVQAGAAPTKKLQDAKEGLDTAKRQSELAESRAALIEQMSRMAAGESYLEELEGNELAYRFEGFDDYEQELLSEIDEMYSLAFGRSPPVSAEGDTAAHRSMGLDHTGRIDIALHPDSEEGMFLLYLLESRGIPYIAFRSVIPGQSTGPHIHVGPPSDPIDKRDSLLGSQ